MSLSSHDQTTVGVEAVTRALPDQGSGERDAACEHASTAGAKTAPSTSVGPRRDVAEFLDRFADGFARADLAAIAACHVTPVLFMTLTRIIEVGVRWTFHDAGGRPLLHDRYRYLLRRVDDQGLLINAVVVLGGSPVGAP